jgi:hypothetical protein
MWPDSANLRGGRPLNDTYRCAVELVRQRVGSFRRRQEGELVTESVRGQSEPLRKAPGQRKTGTALRWKIVCAVEPQEILVLEGG